MNEKNRSHTLIKNTFLLSINKFISPIIAFFLLSIYTNNISTEEYGITDIIQTYVGLLAPILLLRLDVGMFRFLIDKRENKQAISEIITNTIAIVGPTTALASIIMIFAIIFHILPFQIATLFYFISAMANNIINPLTRGLGKNALFAIASIADIVSKLLFGIFFVLILQMGGFGLILSLALSTTINNIICLIGIKTNIRISHKLLNKALRKELIKLSVPIIADGISFWVIDTSDRTLITTLINASANGIYAVANKFSSLISIATSIFWMSWNEQATLAVNDTDYQCFVSKIFNSYFKIVSSLVICVISATPILFKIIIGQNYNEAILYIPPLAIGLLLNAIASFYGPIYLAHKKSKEIAMSTTIAAIINLTIDLLLMRVIGVWAAIISTTIAYLYILIYRCFNVRKFIIIKYNYRAFCSIIALIIINIILYYFNNSIIDIFNVIFAITITIILNKNFVKKIFYLLFRKKTKKPTSNIMI